MATIKPTQKMAIRFAQLAIKSQTEKLTTTEAAEYKCLLKIFSQSEDIADNVLRSHAGPEGRRYECAYGIASVACDTKETFSSETARAKYPDAFDEALKRQIEAGKLTVSKTYFKDKDIIKACTTTEKAEHPRVSASI